MSVTLIKRCMFPTKKKKKKTVYSILLWDVKEGTYPVSEKSFSEVVLSK